MGGRHKLVRRRRRRRSPWLYILLFAVMAVLIGTGIWFLVSGAGKRDEKKSETGSVVSMVQSLAVVSAVSPTPSRAPTPIPDPTPPPVADDGSEGYMADGVYIWQKKAFELFYGDTEVAADYAAVVSDIRKALPNMTVYNMVVPNHSEFGLPKRIREAQGCTSQRTNTSDVYENYTAQVIPVDVYNVLNMHNNEYLYFNTDTHWTALGAYYAYTQFCEKAGIPALPLEGMKKSSVENYTGYLYVATEESVLAENPDRIDLYEPNFIGTVSMSHDGEVFEELPSLNSPDTEMGYAMFAWGDLPLLKTVNPASSLGRKLVMVKDSYGNAMVPYLAATFAEVHVLDFRSFPGRLPEYCVANGITDVLIFNNVMSANTYSQHEALQELIGMAAKK